MDDDGLGLVLDAHHDEALAEEGKTVAGLEVLGRERRAVVHADDVGIVRREVDVVACVGAERAVLVDDLGIDKRGRLATVVASQTDRRGGTCRADRLSAHLPAVLTGYGGDLAGLERHAPHHMILMAVGLAAYALALAVDVEFHLVGVVVVAP